MNESDLQNLLRRAVFRMRLESALKHALAAAVCTLVGAALALFVARWFASDALKLEWLSVAPAILALIFGLAAYLSTRPSYSEAAAILDRRAGTREHLSTWIYLRTRSDPNDALIQHSFKEAQARSTLKAAESVQLKRDLPVRFPNWSRAFWLALILFISAVLTPVADSVSARTDDRTPAVRTSDGSAQSPATGAVQDALLNSVREIPRVQVLSPAQMRKLELIATDPRLPPSMQADALKELQNAIGAVPESELTSDVRQLLETLRELSGQKSSNETKGNTPAISTEANEKSKRTELQPAAEYKAFEAVEKGWSNNEPRFADVKEALSRYYKGAKH